MMATLMNMILGVIMNDGDEEDDTGVMKMVTMINVVTVILIMMIYIHKVRSLPKTFNLCMKSSCSVK